MFQSSSFTFIVLVACSLNNHSDALLVRKYTAQNISESTLVNSSDHNGTSIKTVFECESRAFQSKKTVLIPKLSQDTCKVGLVDVSLDNENEPTIKVFIRDIPDKVGLAHTTDGTTGDFKVVLPSGKICLVEDHEIPLPPTNFHGVREVSGILCLCGGQSREPKEWKGTCYQTDMSKYPLAWEPMAEEFTRGPSLVSRMYPGGLFSYQNGEDDEAVFAIFYIMCLVQNSKHDEHVKMYRNGQWSDMGHVHFIDGSVVQDDRLLFFARGKECVTDKPPPMTSLVKVFDMSSPIDNATDLSYGLKMAVVRPACAVLKVGPRRGIFCAGGLYNTNTFIGETHEALQVRQYKIAQSDIGLKQEFPHFNIKSKLHCEHKAFTLKHWAFKFNKDDYTCKTWSITGVVNTTSTNETGIMRRINVLPERVALCQSDLKSHNYQTGFKVALPNGMVCMPGRHGIPDLPTYGHGATEMDGILYVCGGKYANDSYSDDCFSLDLRKEKLDFETMASISSNRRTLYAGGLVSYKDENETVAIFAIHHPMCNDHQHIQMYKYNSWLLVGKASPDMRVSIVQDDMFIYFVGGRDCLTNTITIKDIRVFDMSRPMIDAKMANQGLTIGLINPACGIMPISLMHGILCAGGHTYLGATSYVQFVPIGNGETTGPCVLLKPLPQPSYLSYLYVYSTGEAGIRSPFSVDTLMWNSDKVEFEVGPQLDMDLMGTRYSGMIGTKWIAEKCSDLF